MGHPVPLLLSASTAALFYEAESLTVVDGALNAGTAPASGGANKVVKQSSIGGAPSRIPFETSNATPLTHIGNYTVWARVFAPNTNTGTVSLWMSYEPFVGGQTITNDTVTLTDSAGAPIENTWCWVDLGFVALPKVKRGNQGWHATFFCSSGGATDALEYDCIALMPVDEGYAVISDDPAQPGIGSTAGVNATAQITHEGAEFQTSATNWRERVVYEGDYLLVPPAGAEARTLRVSVLFAQDKKTSEIYWANAINDVSAHLFVTPRYLT